MQADFYNPDERRAYNRGYYEQNRDRIIEASRERYYTKIEYCRESARLRMKRNRKKTKKYGCQTIPLSFVQN